MEFKKLEECIESSNTGLDAIQKAPIVKYDTGIKCIRIGDISQNNEYDKWGFTKVSDDNYRKFALKKGDILIARTGNTIGVNKYISNNMCSVYNNGLIRLRVNKDKCDSLFIYYIMQQKRFKDFVNSIAFGTSTQPNMKIKDLLSYEIPFFDKNYQKKIVDILKQIDYKIEENTATNDNLHEIAENYFKELSKDGIETKLEDLIYEIQSGSREKGGAVKDGIPSIGAEKIEKLGTYNFESEKYISEEYFKKMKNGVVNSGDVLLYKDGAYAGKISMALNGFPHRKCAINEHVFILRTEKNWANCYLYFLLYYSKIREQVQAMASSKAAQPGLNQTEVKNIKIKLPSKEKIEEFEEKAIVIVEKIIQNSIENKNLAQLRDTLLPKLMSGEIDLDNIEI